MNTVNSLHRFIEYKTLVAINKDKITPILYSFVCPQRTRINLLAPTWNELKWSDKLVGYQHSSPRNDRQVYNGVRYLSVDVKP